jgi:IclR family pca regulon transcriptional regulator
MEELSDKTGEVVGLGALSGNEIVLIEIIKTDQLLNINMNTGAIIPPNSTSTGKAILAFLPEPDVERIFHHKKPVKFTSKTITSLKSYKRQLEVVREKGYALAEDENAYGFGAIAAPIRDMQGNVSAAVNIMVPSFRVPKEKLIKSFRKPILETSQKISAAVGFPAGF